MTGAEKRAARDKLAVEKMAELCANRTASGPGSKAGLRPKKKGHPFLWGRPKGVFYPDAVGVVPSYPKSPEDFLARQIAFRERMRKGREAGIATWRKGIPDGFAKSLPKANQMQAKAAVEARKILAVMKMEDLIVSDDVGDEALLAVITISRDMSQTVRERHAACKTVLEYSKPKPATRSQVEFTRPEDFLDELLAASAE